MSTLAALQEALGVSFSDRSLLEQSLIHSSYVNENPGLARFSNERLEFLGDAVLGLIAAETLYRRSPALTEGQMTRLRAVLVRRETLARFAQAIRLGNYLYLGKGEEAGGGRQRQANLAGAFEALTAAVYLDRGLDVVRDFIFKFLKPELERAVSPAVAADYKSALQELIQASEQQTPSYHVKEVTGPEHDRVFTVEVSVGGRMLGSGSGKSKKTAEEEAARSALAGLSEQQGGKPE
ncbi:MAG: ribonuclease III [Chloroflexi bacterium]|nr:ribonuclease III [Chloroflexota bacterium]